MIVQRRSGAGWGVGGQFDEIVYFLCACLWVGLYSLFYCILQYCILLNFFIVCVFEFKCTSYNIDVYFSVSILEKVLFVLLRSFYTVRVWWSGSNFLNIFCCSGCVKPSLQNLAFSITAWQLPSEVWKHRLIFFSSPLVLSLITGLGKSQGNKLSLIGN